MSISYQEPPHFALLPSSGMGHLTPFLSLAAALCNRGCTISFITSQPTVSNAESLRISQLLDAFPNIQSLNLPLVELDPSEFPPTSDPFFLRFEAIRRSAHLLHDLLVSASSGSSPLINKPSPSSPISVLIIDIVSASTFVPVAKKLNISSYVLFTSSAAMLALCAYFPTYVKNTEKAEDVHIPGVTTVGKSSLPPPLQNPNHLFTIQFLENGKILSEPDGILLNTFRSLEPDAIHALNTGQVVCTLPPLFPIGPLSSVEALSSSIPWLDLQPQKSVVYVSFGSRTAMTADQIKKLGAGLERSEQRYLWVIKTKIVDKEEEGERNMEVREKGMVINGWVEQEEILRHPAVGLFVSHCGWNSVMEAAIAGVRVLGWPRMGDQRVNAEVVQKSGLGVWMEEWSWEAEGRVVSGEEIAKKLKEMIEHDGFKKSAERVGAEARKAVGGGGSSRQALEDFIRRC